jgi:hypoxanthine-guanine phosphoribosyltransferase
MSHFDNPTQGTGYQSPLQNIHLQNTSQKLLLIEDIADSTTTEVLEIKE